MFEKLSSPITIGNVKIKNRMFMAPMDTGFGNTSYGTFTPEGIDYFVRRAEGGFGLLFSGGINADTIVDNMDGILNHPELFKSVGKEMNNRLSKYNCKMFIQLSMNVGRNAGLKTPSPLPVLGNPSQVTQELTVEEIHKKVEEMGQAAKLVQEAGYAGVDIHAMHWGHLIDSFALSFMNHRNDEYGGSLENRLRFTKEIVEEIKKQCGKDFPVTIRLALKSYMKDFDKASFDGSDEVGRTPDEAVQIAKLLESYGYDALSTDTGTLDAFYYAMPPAYIPAGYSLPMVKMVKDAVSIPILAGSRMADPTIDEKALEDGIIDAAVIGRQAIADSDFGNKITEGRQDLVRTCIGCNQGCIWGYFTSGKISCAVNPEVGHEKDYPIAESDTKKNVVIVGGGIAGMEAARICTIRGHHVTLYEKSNVLGGNLIPAGAHDFKKEVNELNEHYRNMMKEMNIHIVLNKEMNAQKILSLHPDTVILAMGSSPVMPKSIPGIDHLKAVSGVDALLGKKTIGESVVIVGGGLVGCEIAFGYAKEGKQVTIVEALDEIMKLGSVPSMNKQMLNDGFAYYGTKILTSSKLLEINDEGAKVELSDHSVITIPCDNVVLSIGYRPNPSIAKEFEGTDVEIHEIGDGSKVGNILTAVNDAFNVSKNI